MTSTTRSSPAARLPLELVEIILTYLTYDTRSLLTCSLVCHSWYTAAVPHLCHTVATGAFSCFPNFKWPKPLSRMHKLGLLPLAKALWVRSGQNHDGVGFSPKMFNRHTLRQFRALTNVQYLSIDHLDIPNFMLQIQRYFGNFLPTLQFLGLKEPRGSNRQTIHFIGHFQHLQDLRLIYIGADVQGGPVDDPALIPHFAPPCGDRWGYCISRGWAL